MTIVTAATPSGDVIGVIDEVIEEILAGYKNGAQIVVMCTKSLVEE